jgi:hypothetical protein
VKCGIWPFMNVQQNRQHIEDCTGVLDKVSSLLRVRERKIMYEHGQPSLAHHLQLLCCCGKLRSAASPRKSVLYMGQASF